MKGLSLSSFPPSEDCFSCRGCCVFDRSDSPWLPYFSKEEIDQAIAFGVSESAFSSRTGSKIIPLPHGDFVRCPALNPVTHACTIYTVRPLDCQLYPFILMRDKTDQVILALHEACPFVLSSSGDLHPEIQKRAETLTQFLQSPETVALLATNPNLIMPIQPDTIPVVVLDHLTDALTCPLRPFQYKDYPIFSKFRSQGENRLYLAHSAFQPHFIWSDLLDYQWAIIANAFCLFATSHGITHLAWHGHSKQTVTDGRCETIANISASVAVAFRAMTDRNPKHVPCRIDNLDEQTAQLLDKAGYHVEQISFDYLYKRDEIVHLAGNRFHSQRALVNQAARRQPILRPFVPQDTANCLVLLEQWVTTILDSPESPNRIMREDARFAHNVVMKWEKELRLIGRVVEIDHLIAGYTFGFWLASDQFCVLIEIADRSIRGLSAWLFHEFCREQSGAIWINTMDDGGLPGLAQSKRSWHPAKLIPSYTATMRL